MIIIYKYDNDFSHKLSHMYLLLIDESLPTLHIGDVQVIVLPKETQRRTTSQWQHSHMPQEGNTSNIYLHHMTSEKDSQFKYGNMDLKVLRL